MFKVIAAPITVIISVCQALNSFASGLNNLAESFEEVTKVANNAASTWSQEEEAINASKLSDLKQRIEEAKAANKPFQREDDIEL